MIGAIIGDVVGSRYEFKNLRDKNFPFFSPACFFTDDSVCTIATAEWLVNSDSPRSLSMRGYRKRLVAWTRKYPDMSYGGSFRGWIYNPEPYDSFGNGAAMRVAPVGFAASSLRECMELAAMTAMVSHSHVEGVKGAQATAGAIYLARHGATKSEISDFITRVFDYDLAFTCDYIRPINRFDETCQVCVPQAIVCFLESENFEDCIRLAVSIGGDSDTIAAIAGGIAEAFYGIPESLILKARTFLSPDLLYIVDRFNSMYYGK